MKFEVNKSKDSLNIPDNTRTLCWNINRMFDRDDIPDGVIHFIFGECYNKELDSNIIPNSVTHLTFGERFNQRLGRCHIPNSVTHLTFGDEFNQKLHKDHIPNSVTHLSFGDEFNQKLRVGHIPDGVTHLKFGYGFNQKLCGGRIPISVTHVTFGNNFRQILHVDDIPSVISIYNEGRCQPIDLTHIPPYVNIYMDSVGKIKLGQVKHKIYLKATHDRHQTKIINGKVEGVHYVETIVENDVEYLVVHSDDYKPYTTRKSARK